MDYRTALQQQDQQSTATTLFSTLPVVEEEEGNNEENDVVESHQVNTAAEGINNEESESDERLTIWESMKVGNADDLSLHVNDRICYFDKVRRYSIVVMWYG